jgi:hypothetical protein
VSLGGTLEPVRVSGEARALAVGGDLVGVDLLPRPSGELVVLELNGAVDFDDRYALGGRDPCVEAARSLFGAAAAAPRAGRSAA